MLILDECKCVVCLIPKVLKAQIDHRSMESNVRSYWKVVFNGKKSVWEEVAVRQSPKPDYEHRELTYGPGDFHYLECRDWNEPHGCPDKMSCNLQIILSGVFEVKADGVSRVFGPGQEDGQVIYFADILPEADSAKGHRTRVVEDIVLLKVKELGMEVYLGRI